MYCHSRKQIARVGLVLSESLYMEKAAAAGMDNRVSMDVNQHLIDDPEKLAVIGRFSGRVAHEFNNLLTPLLAYPEILKSMFDPADQDGQELVNVMAGAASELARMSRQMTQLSLGESVVGQSSFAMKDAWKATLDPLESDFGDRVTSGLMVEISSDLPKVQGRADTACHAIETIVRNALEASPDGQPVRVSAQVELRPAGVTRFGRQTGPWSAVVVSVEDRGAGIPESIRDTLFEPFVTSKKVDGKRRLGVGLTIAHRVVRALNGDIEFDVPTAGTGTRVRILFPVAVA
jgi:signal transduction histidine kinase